MMLRSLFTLTVLLLAAAPALAWGPPPDDRSLVGKPFSRIQAVLPEPTETLTDVKKIPYPRTRPGDVFYIYHPVTFVVPSRNSWMAPARPFDCKLSILVSSSYTITSIAKEGNDCNFSILQMAH